MSDGTWEERMAARAAAAHEPALRSARDAETSARREYLTRMFEPFWPAGVTGEVLPQVIAAACLGIEYGDPGPPLDAEACRECWGDRHVWLGNCWGMQHAGSTMTGCGHSCHVGEVWLAAAG